ncbi:MAG: polysaccharide biosynthesis protein [Planctomycetota bacterium]|jgi:UDP-N-acetylglucosamine 4,6-dehydratase
MLSDKIILVTGGTGSFGRAFIKRILAEYDPKKVIVYSRDEYKQHEMAKEITDGRMRWHIGDVRDLARLKRAFSHVDYVIHAAALKQVSALEYCPTEAIKTNVLGATVALSSDKAVDPINLYGATKLVAEKLFIAANVYNRTCFCCVRYGNVIGSRGSVIPFFQNLKRLGKKEFPITDKRMTRFWISMDEAVDLVLFALGSSMGGEIYALGSSMGGEIYVPRIPSMLITDVARAIEPDCSFRIIGIRPGEKVHEKLISLDANNVYVVDDGQMLPAVSSLSSDTNSLWMTIEELKEILNVGN